MNKQLRNTIGKWTILLALCGYMVLMGVWASREHGSMPVTDIVIEVDSDAPAASFLTPEAVRNELGTLLDGYSKKNINNINLDSLEQRLSRINNFEHVECAVTSQGKLLIRVVPMIPEIRVFSSNGSYYVNRDGKRLDAHAEYFADLPVVYGDFSPKMPAKGVLPVTRFIASDSVLKNLVAMVDYKNPQNIYIIPRIHGHIVNIGDTTRLREKFDNLLLMYRKVMPHKGWNMYDTISVKYAGQIVATRRDKTQAVHSLVTDEDFDPEEAMLQEQQKELNATETGETAQAESSENNNHNQP